MISTRRLSLLVPFTLIAALVFPTSAMAADAPTRKAASTIAAALNRISTPTTTAADFTAIAAGTSHDIAGVTATPLPFFRNIVFFDVVTPGGRLCVAVKPPYSAKKPRYSVVNADCQTYANILGPDLDRALLAIAKTEIRLGLNLTARSLFGLRSAKFTPQIIQNYAASRDPTKYTVVNTTAGVQISITDRPSVKFTVIADARGRYRIA